MSAERQRIDKWLFFARVAKSRTLAAKFAQGGHVRVNGAKISQASQEVKPGDVLTMTLPNRVVVCKIVDCGARRGPASEARLLYEDMSPPPPPKSASALDRIAGKRETGAGRPTKKERRAIDKLLGEDD
jgi:ribosome-associated heat shock protein Hsp15